MITLANALALASILILAQPRRQPTPQVPTPPTVTAPSPVTPAATWTYSTVNPAPIPTDAQLRTVFAAGDWLIVNAGTGNWQVNKPVPCSPAVSTNPKDDCFFVNDATGWNGMGFCARRLK